MIYIVSDGYAFKIGYTAGMPTDRLRALQIGNPRRLTLVALFPGSLLDERRLHERFAAQRLAGEWFALSQVDIRLDLVLHKGVPFDEHKGDEAVCGVKDDLAGFLQSAYDLHPARRDTPAKELRRMGISVTVADLRQAYTIWCLQAGEKAPLGPTAFKAGMEAHGCPQSRDRNDNRAYLGLVLRGMLTHITQAPSEIGDDRSP